MVELRVVVSGLGVVGVFVGRSFGVGFVGGVLLGCVVCCWVGVVGCVIVECEFVGGVVVLVWVWWLDCWIIVKVFWGV